MKKSRIAAILAALVLGISGCTGVVDSTGTEVNSNVVETEAVEGETAESETEKAEGKADSADTTESAEEEESSEGADTSSETEETEGSLVVNFIDVGQGDSILITQGDHHMLIDGGENDQGTKVQSYIQANNIKELEYVVGTHPDSDHIGGLDVIIYKFDCKNILMPEYSKDTKTYEEVIASVETKGYKVTHPSAGDTFALGDASVEVLSPQEGADYGENANDYSIALKVTYRDTSFLFTGDCEEAAEEDMLNSGYDLSADVMKAGHHGSNTSNMRELLEKVSPETVVISCGEGNDYGHPRAEVLNNLRSMGVKVFRTDEQGTIVAVSNGSEIVWNASPSESWQAGEPKGSGKESKEETSENKEELVENEETAEGNSGTQETVQVQETVPVAADVQSQETTYILNTNTMKIHYPSCRSVSQMSEKNKQATSKSVEELKAAGYEPCKNCNP